MEYKIPDCKLNIKDLSIKNTITTNNNSYLINLGFQPYYSDNVVKLYDPKYPVRIRLQFKGKLKRYKITQPYNYTIQQNTEIQVNKIESIEDAFENKYKYKSNKQDFYKLWEVIHNYNILGKTNKSTDDYGKKIIELNKKELKDKDFDALIINNKIKMSNCQEKIYNQSIIKDIKLIKNLNKGGNLVIKLYTLFTSYTNELIVLLSQMFKDAYIYIPYTVETYRNEKYLVCLDYKQNDDILDFINSLNNNYETLGIQLNDKYIKFITELNINELLKQTTAINKMEEYIKNNNYFGNEYEEYYKDAVKKSKEWINKFINKK